MILFLSQVLVEIVDILTVRLTSVLIFQFFVPSFKPQFFLKDQKF